MKKNHYLLKLALGFLIIFCACNKKDTKSPNSSSTTAARPSSSTGLTEIGCDAAAYPITGFNLSSTKDRAHPCREIQSKWEELKTKFTSSKVLTPLQKKYENYEFYRIYIQGLEHINQYKASISSFKQNMSYIGLMANSDPLKQICDELTPEIDGCIDNCIYDTLAINITEYIKKPTSRTEPDGSVTSVDCLSEPTHCGVRLSFCGSGQTYWGPVIKDGSSDFSIQTFSDLIKDSSCSNIRLEDGYIVFPKPISECLDSDKIRDKLCDLIIDKDSQTPINTTQEEYNKIYQTSTKLKLEYTNKQYNYRYIPQTKEDVVSTYVKDIYPLSDLKVDGFSCSFK